MIRKNIRPKTIVCTMACASSSTSRQRRSWLIYAKKSDWTTSYTCMPSLWVMTHPLERRLADCNFRAGFSFQSGLTTKCLTEVILLAMAAKRDDIQAARTALAQVKGIKFIPLFDELELGAHLRPASSLEADQCKPGIASTWQIKKNEETWATDCHP